MPPGLRRAGPWVVVLAVGLGGWELATAKPDLLPRPYPWQTVQANAALGLEARGESKRLGHRVDEALSLVGLDGLDMAYPRQISGGMAQRAALARALVNDPGPLTLDGPLGKLDSLTRLQMQGELVRICQDRGFTALLVTHDAEEALLLANRAVVVSDRPAATRADLSVPLPYPRHRDDPEIVRLRREVGTRLGLGARQLPRQMAP